MSGDLRSFWVAKRLNPVLPQPDPLPSSRQIKETIERPDMNGTSAPFPDRDSVAAKLAALGESEQSYLALLMENAAQDESLIEGLYRHLDLASEAKLLNSLKLEKIGEWLGSNAPARLQIRLMEAAKSSQHAAYQAFRTGLIRSGGLEKAYPKA
jgi:hypothetical protein